MRLKRWLLFVVLLVSLPIVLADWNTQFTCDSGENCTISVFTVMEDEPRNLTDADYCYLFVHAPNGTQVLSGGMMTLVPNSLYTYVVNYVDVGHYPSYVRCDKKGLPIHIMSSGNPKDTTATTSSFGDTKDVSFEVVQGDDWMLAVLLPLLAIIGVLAYFSIRMEQLHYFIKVLLFLGSLSLTIVAVNVGRILVEEQSPASVGLISLLNTASFVLIILLIVVTAYLIIYYIAELLWSIASTKFGKTP